MRLFIASLLLSASLATPALAQDEPTADKEFQGFKIVSLVGVDQLNTPAVDATGFFYGGTIGYDLQAGKAVYGIEGEVGDSTGSGCRTNVIVAGDTLCNTARRDLYVGARAGVVIGQKTLLYVKAGYSNAQILGTYLVGPNGIGNTENLDGWRLGGGAEFNLSRKVFARGEYRYTNYDQGVSRHQGLIGLGIKF